MSGVEALGVACSVFQTISFAHEVISLCRDVYQGNPPDGYLKTNAQNLGMLSLELRDHHLALSPRTASQTRICDIAEQCRNISRSLEEEVTFILGRQAKGDLFATLKVAAKSNWRRTRLNKLEKKLNDYERELNTHLSARICTQNDAVQIKRTEQYATLNESVRRVVNSIAQGNTALVNAMHKSTASIQDHTQKEVRAASGQLQSHVTSTVLQAQIEINERIDLAVKQVTERHEPHETAPRSAAREKAQEPVLSREDILKRFKFTEMRQRQASVHASHEGTFSWIFESQSKSPLNRDIKHPNENTEKDPDSQQRQHTAEDCDDDWTSASDESSEANAEGDPERDHTMQQHPDATEHHGDDRNTGSDESSGGEAEEEKGEALVEDNAFAADENTFSSIESEDEEFRRAFPHDESDTYWSILKARYGTKRQKKRPWDSFEDWLKSESNIYWISGKPGSGKSTLVKHLVDHPYTPEALEFWSPNTAIISHFFWKPGSALQNSIQGLHLSLIHQLMAHESCKASYICESLPKHVTKWILELEQPLEWSDEQLTETFLTIMHVYPVKVCIFLDGLDEIGDKDRAAGILNWIHDTCASCPNIKLCVASRPEPPLVRELSNFQHLHLHDLTAWDLITYAHSELKKQWKRSGLPLKDLSHLLYCLLDKASGVFLWLHLALRSLCTGFGFGDTFEDLEKRLNDLPTELSDLYAEMWNRLNLGSGHYKESSARYLNVMVDIERPSDRMFGAPFERHLTLLDFRLIADLDFQAKALQNEHTVADLYTRPEWDKLVNEINTKGAGLIEVRKTSTKEALDEEMLEIFKDEEKIPHDAILLLSKIDFTHRSAYDFLTDTEDGERIRSYGTSTSSQRCLQIARGFWAKSRLLRPAKLLRRMVGMTDLLGSIDKLKFAGDIQQILDNAQKHMKYISQEVPIPKRCYYSGVFLSIASLGLPEYMDWILAQIGYLRDDLAAAREAATMVLSSISSFHSLAWMIIIHGSFGWSYDSYRATAVEKLIRCGADINRTGASSARLFGGLTLRQRQAHPWRSTYGLFLTRAIWQDNISGDIICDILSSFLSRRPAMDQRVVLGFTLPVLGDNGSGEVHLAFPTGWGRHSIHCYFEMNLALLTTILIQRITNGSCSGVSNTTQLPWFAPSVLGESVPQDVPIEYITFSHHESWFRRSKGQDHYVGIRRGKLARTIVRLTWNWLCAANRKEFEKSRAWQLGLKKIQNCQVPKKPYGADTKFHKSRVSYVRARKSFGKDLSAHQPIRRGHQAAQRISVLSHQNSYSYEKHSPRRMKDKPTSTDHGAEHLISRYFKRRGAQFVYQNKRMQ